MNVRTCLLFLLSLCLGSVPAMAQNYIYATGSPVYATSLPIDHGIVNVNNGEIHLEIPLATKTQRGDLALSEKLVYDSRIWKIVQNGSSLLWQPTNSPGAGGWSFSSGFGSGSVTFNSYGGEDPHPPACEGSPSGEEQSYTQYNGWTWTDATGTAHSFPAVSTLQYGQNNDANCLGTSPGTPTSSGAASDGSGYTLQITNFTTPTITSLNGTVYHPNLVANNPPPQSQDVVDRNGNYWSADSNGNLVDTSGIAPVLVSSSGNNTYYDVLGVSGVRNRYTVTMETVSFDTDFSENAVKEDSGSFRAIQSIALPDGSSYSFTYNSGTASGNYGEMTSMTLPTGGVISFGYTNFYDSFKNENRWLSSIVKDGGTTTFTPAVISQCSSSQGCQENMTVVPPDGNATVYTFNLDKTALIAGSSWVSSIKSYQGSASSGTLLRTTTTAYTYTSYSTETDENGTYYVTGSYEIPASIINTVTLNDVGVMSQTSTMLNGGVCPEEVKVWNYGNASSNAPDTDTVYSGPCDFPSSIIEKDGSGNQLSSITYGYDETTPVATSGVVNHTSAGSRSNRTSEHDWVNTSGTTLNTTMTYDDTGALLTSTSPNGKTTYGHDSTDTFVTSTTNPPVPSGVLLATSSAYDASTGAVTSTTDENGKTTTYSGFDMFNRPTSIAYPDGGSTTIIYRNPNQLGVFRAQNSSQAMETETLYDGYGRVSRVAVGKNAANSDWYQTDTCYNTDGQTSFESYQYEGAGGGAAKVCSGAGDGTSYDALNRPLIITHGDSTHIGYQYKGRATEVTDENGVARITQTDAFGRPTSVCEISPNTLQGDAPTSCGTDIGGTGFITNYAYNLASHLTTVTQGVQTRTFQTDSLGRSIATSEPERGQTSYAYAYSSTGLVVTRTRPRANQTSASVTTTTTTQYDAEGRPISMAYSDGTPTKTYQYDTSAGWGQAQSNLKGLLSKAQVPALGNYEGDIFSYDAMGRVVFTGQCFAYGCGNGADDKYSTEAYDWLGNLTSETDPTNLTIGYAYNPANQLTGITSSNTAAGDPTQLISNVQNGPDGPVSYQQGNGLGDYRTYDGMGRNDGKWVCQGTSPSYHCATGSEPQVYGTELGWSGSEVTSDCDTAMGCRNFGYDEFGRLKSQTATSGTSQSFTYTYDRYGNRWQQNVTAGSGPQPQVEFDKTNNRDCDSCYDAAGNMTGDGIHSYTYDAEGNVTAVDSGSTATYTYDALNRRVRVANSTNTVDYQFDAAGRRTVEWQESANFGIRGTVYWGSTPIAFHGINGTEYFEQQDWLGTERVRTDYTGAVVGSYVSLAFGDGFSASGTDEDPYHFAGTDRDSESATDHAQFRQFREATGRWMSPDPYDGSYDWSDPQSYNRYAYVMGNPIASVDPSGLFTNGATDGGGGDGNGFAGLLANLVADAAEELFKALFGGASFHGSLNPRPTEGVDSNGTYAVYAGQIDYDYNISPRFGALIGASNNGEPPSPCLVANINAVNAVSNLNVNASNVVGQPFIYNGGMDVNFSVPGGSPSSLPAGRYPSSFLNSLFGIGSSLHVPGAGGADPSTYGMSNGNFTFTTHIDSAYSTWHTPIGALIHFFTDVRGQGAHRKPC